MKRLLALVLLFIAGKCYAQNLVMNPSFEDTIPCVIYNNIGPPQLPCISWFWATAGSVDYFNNYCGDIFYGSPINAYGFQNARTGTAYCGLDIWNIPIPFPNYREYLEGQLIDTLQYGHVYCVSFYIVSTDSCKYYTSDIGAYFSVDSVFDQNSSSDLPLTPQVVNINGIVYDSSNWVQISGYFTAQGGEKYITIGNFKNDAITMLDSNNQTNLFYGMAYYYLDDVSVIDCTTGLDEINNHSIDFTFTPNPAKENLKINLTNSRDKIVKAEILNTLGKTVLKKDNPYLLNPLHIESLGKGIYFIKIATNKGAGVKKFVKE